MPGSGVRRRCSRPSSTSEPAVSASAASSRSEISASVHACPEPQTPDEHDLLEPQLAVLDLGDVLELGGQAGDAAQRRALLEVELVAVVRRVHRPAGVQRASRPGRAPVRRRRRPPPARCGPTGASSVSRVVGCGSVTRFLSSRAVPPGSHARVRTAATRYFAAGRARGAWVASAREPSTTTTSPRSRPPPTSAAPCASASPVGTSRWRPPAASSPPTTSTSAPGCCSTTSRRRPAEGDLLDLGCGWGPIALTLALRVARRPRLGGRRQRARARPRAPQRRAARRDQRPRRSRPTTCPTTCGSRPSGRTRRSGSARTRCTRCSLRWLGRRAPGGEAHLVVGKNLGADSLQRWLAEELGLPTSSGPRARRASACSPCADR